MADYVPHTEAEIESMLAFIGLERPEQLFDVVPDAMRLASGLDLAPGIAEADVMDRMEALAGRNRAIGRDLVCFAGGGAYDHEVPAVTRSLALRSEFLTAYTPYQPEVSQGVLQALFEFQTMVARLAGLPVANASLYDGAAALVEGVNMSVAASGRSGVWVSEGLSPSWREVLATFAEGSGHTLVEVPLVDGRSAWDEAGGEAPGVLVAAYPNCLGCLEDLSAARELADRWGAQLVVAFDPVAAGILRPAGRWGADVAVGEGQALGTPLSFGGPYLGLLACAESHIRRIPGRLVGETLDSAGKVAYVTTLRAREQDIRRERASSNVCTNQTLMAVTTAIQLGWLGTAGLREVALRCARGARYCREALLAIEGVRPLVDAPVLREFAVRAPVPGAVLVDRLADAGFLAGVPLVDGRAPAGCEDGLLVSVTERRTREEIDAFAAAFEKAVR